MVRLALMINRTSGRFVRGNDEALARRLTEHPAVADVWDFGVDTIGDRIAAAQDDGYDGIAIAGGATIINTHHSSIAITTSILTATLIII